ncbi:MAG: hypothetical protein IMW98_03660 [Firmicutes bacterium]|nr:hypothetical protein [Bacillota bacterium]
MITQGRLDDYLAMPRDVLLHTLVSRIHPANVGDLLFGPAVFLLFGHPTWERLALFAVSSLGTALLFMGFTIEWPYLLGLLGAAAVFHALGVWLFRRGLRRYESGNLLNLRG